MSDSHVLVPVVMGGVGADKMDADEFTRDGETIKRQRVIAQDPWMEHAKQVIFAEYGVSVSMEAKNKDLLKFGRNALTNATKSTLMTLPAGIDNETYVSSNLINTISSSSASDTYSITIEGHTISGGVFTFVTQTLTLTGQTQKALTTALARVSRTYNNGSVDSVGRIYIYETDTSTAGVPTTAAKVHLIQEAGVNNSEKASTTLSNSDYWVITGFYGDCLEKTTAYAIIHFEVRLAGKVFTNKVDIAANTSSPAQHDFLPYIVIPPNADIRLRASANAAGKDVSGGIQGVLLKA